MRASKALLFPMILFFGLSSFSQVNADLEQGMKPYGSYHGGDLDHISLSNGNLFFQADLLTYSQRSGELSYPIVLRYNEENLSEFQNCQPGQQLTQCQINVIFGPQAVAPQGISYGNAMYIGYEGLPSVVGNALDPGFSTGLAYYGSLIYVQTSSVVTPDGSLHQLVGTNNGQVTTDGSGFFLDSNGVLHDRGGTKYSSSTAEDANGNQISLSTGKDTLGRQISALPGPAYPAATPPTSTASLSSCPTLNYAHQPVTYAYTWAVPTINGGTLPLTLCYASVYVRTNFFNGENSNNWHELSQSFAMLQSLVFPDNTYWAFEYDAADPNDASSIAFADLLKVTLPTGGSISYTWGPCSCATLYARSVMTRSVDANDGTGSKTWNYSYTNTPTARLPWCRILLEMKPRMVLPNWVGCRIRSMKLRPSIFRAHIPVGPCSRQCRRITSSPVIRGIRM
jgi:hypothetical protein